ncbi:hypothetical protein T492DRAFT_977601 [Pavlovales sp. CCMP2436]|nr:hypothetical protein T492DRAFT_977601 [Pavlovales sp. CCMP2436]
MLKLVRAASFGRKGKSNKVGKENAVNTHPPAGAQPKEDKQPKESEGIRVSETEGVFALPLKYILSVTSLSNSGPSGTESPNCFKIQATGGRTLLLKAAGPNYREEWVQGLTLRITSAEIGNETGGDTDAHSCGSSRTPAVPPVAQGVVTVGPAAAQPEVAVEPPVQHEPSRAAAVRSPSLADAGSEDELDKLDSQPSKGAPPPRQQPTVPVAAPAELDLVDALIARRRLEKQRQLQAEAPPVGVLEDIDEIPTMDDTVASSIIRPRMMSGHRAVRSSDSSIDGVDSARAVHTFSHAADDEQEVSAFKPSATPSARPSPPPLSRPAPSAAREPLNGALDLSDDDDESPPRAPVASRATAQPAAHERTSVARAHEPLVPASPPARSPPPSSEAVEPAPQPAAQHAAATTAADEAPKRKVGDGISADANFAAEDWDEDSDDSGMEGEEDVPSARKSDTEARAAATRPAATAQPAAASAAAAPKPAGTAGSAEAAPSRIGDGIKADANFASEDWDDDDE